MNITQEPKFQPITITIETKEEAEIFLGMVLVAHTEVTNGAQEDMAFNISNWFSNDAQMGG